MISMKPPELSKRSRGCLNNSCWCFVQAALSSLLWDCESRNRNQAVCWANYSDLSQGHPKWWFSQGILSIYNALYSGLGIIVIDLPRYYGWLMFISIFCVVFFAFKPVWSSGLFPIMQLGKKTGHSLTSGHIANQAPKKMSRQTRAEFSIWWTESRNKTNDHFMARFAKTHLWKPVLLEIYLIPIYIYIAYITQIRIYLSPWKLRQQNFDPTGSAIFSKTQGFFFPKKHLP